MSNLFSCYSTKTRCQRQYFSWISINFRTQEIQAVQVDRAPNDLWSSSTSTQTIPLKIQKRRVFHFWITRLRSGDKQDLHDQAWSWGSEYTRWMSMKGSPFDSLGSSGLLQEKIKKIVLFHLESFKSTTFLRGDDCLENSSRHKGRQAARNRPYQAKRRRASTAEPLLYNKQKGQEWQA